MCIIIQKVKLRRGGKEGRKERGRERAREEGKGEEEERKKDKNSTTPKSVGTLFFSNDPLENWDL